MVKVAARPGKAVDVAHRDGRTDRKDTKRHAGSGRTANGLPLLRAGEEGEALSMLVTVLGSWREGSLGHARGGPVAGWAGCAFADNWRLAWQRSIALCGAGQ